MRERIARALSALVVGCLVVLAVAVARARTPPGVDGPPARDAAVEGPAADASWEREAPPVMASQQAADSARGRALFERHGCTGCHSVSGVGSPRLPLDGVGARRTPAELRAWTTGAQMLADSLAPSVLRRKQEFAGMPADELDALVGFLASLKTGG